MKLSLLFIHFCAVQFCTFFVFSFAVYLILVLIRNKPLIPVIIGFHVYTKTDGTSLSLVIL